MNFVDSFVKNHVVVCVTCPVYPSTNEKSSICSAQQQHNSTAQSCSMIVSFCTYERSSFVRWPCKWLRGAVVLLLSTAVWWFSSVTALAMSNTVIPCNTTHLSSSVNWLPWSSMFHSLLCVSVSHIHWHSCLLHRTYSCPPIISVHYIRCQLPPWLAHPSISLPHSTS